MIDESVTFCHPTPQLHNDIDTSPLQNIITPAKKPKSDMSTVKIEALIAALKNYVGCEISMINPKLTSFCEHIAKTISNLNHREDKHLESCRIIFLFSKRNYLLKTTLLRVLLKLRQLCWSLSQLHKECLLQTKTLWMHQKLLAILP